MKLRSYRYIDFFFSGGGAYRSSVFNRSPPPSLQQVEWYVGKGILQMGRLTQRHFCEKRCAHKATFPLFTGKYMDKQISEFSNLLFAYLRVTHFQI